MNDNVFLLICITALDIIYIPSLLDKNARMHPFTICSYLFFLSFAMTGYIQSNMYLTATAQFFGMVEWTIMLFKSTDRIFWIKVFDTLKSGGINLLHE